MAKRASAGRTIKVTKNYRLFERSLDNRPLDPKKHKKLLESMKRYGFLKCFPIVCRPNGKVQIIKEGQHRHLFAEMLGLPIYWVQEDVEFDIAVINCTPKTWTLRDFAQKYAANGNAAYQEGLEFADAHHLPIGTAFALLHGTRSYGNIRNSFEDGTWKVKDRAWADAVAGIYGPLVAMSTDVRNARFIEACMAVCRVKEFDARRLLVNAKRCRDKLVSYSTRDAYLDMLESIYNFGRHALVGLKAAACMAMRERNAVTKAVKAKASKGVSRKTA